MKLFYFLKRGKGRKRSGFLDSDTPDGEDVPEDRLEEINRRIWELRRLLREAMGAGVEATFVQVLNRLARQGDQIRAAIVAWVELLEILVQDAEQRNGPGTGALKASEVKQVVHYLLRRQDRDLPHGDDIINPILRELVADWTIDAIVSVSNKNGLWVAEPPAEMPWWRRLLTGLAAALNRFLNGLVRFIRWIFGPAARLFDHAGTLPPRLRAAADKVADLPGARSRELLTELIELKIWLGEHRRQVVAVVDLVDAAVKTAEDFKSATGPEKKAYATTLVWAVLKDLGFVPASGFLGILFDTLISATIDSVVMLFNKRGLFS